MEISHMWIIGITVVVFILSAGVFENFFIGVGASIVALIVSIFLVPIIAHDFKNYEYTYGLRSIVLGQETKADGWFFLIAGGGSYGKAGRYYFYVENADGTIGQHSLESKDVLFKETEGKEPATVTCKYMGDEQPRFSEVVTDCVFTIPKGSIGTDIDIDLKNVTE